MSDIGPLSLPHDIEAIWQELKLDEQLDPALKRRVANALSMLVENFREIEDRATQTVGLFPQMGTDPPNPADGQAWINTVAGKLRVRINGSTVDLN